jgi:L-asparaginase/Glu-tRNA(Gln) amidotransferase subunit D
VFLALESWKSNSVWINLIGDETETDQIPAGFVEGGTVHTEALHHGVIGIVTQAPGVGHGDQKQIERRRRVAAQFYVTVTDQTVIQPVEPRRGFSDSIRT